MGSLVFLKNPKGYLNIIFLLLCCDVAYWGFAEFHYRTAESAATASFWIHMNFLWPFSTALLLHFILIYTRTNRLLKQPLIFAVLYIPSLIIAAIAIFTNRFSSNPVQMAWGWDFGTPDTLINILCTGWVSLIGLLAGLVAIIFYLRLNPGEKKNQASYVVIGLSIPVIIGTTTDAFGPALGLRMPEMAVTSFAIGVAGFIGLAMWKYELFELTPQAVASEIVSTMADGLMLVSPD